MGTADACSFLIGMTTDALAEDAATTPIVITKKAATASLNEPKDNGRERDAVRDEWSE